ncbi:MAG: DUF4271 domain-containing protein [Ginsengibacter sp.]
MNRTFLMQIKVPQLIWLLCFVCAFQNNYAQVKDSLSSKKDSIYKIENRPRTPKKIVHDSTNPVIKQAQKRDTLKNIKKRDTLLSNVIIIKKDTVRRDSILPALNSSITIVAENAGERFTKKIKYINLKDPPVYFLNEKRNVEGKEYLFYSIFVLLLFLGFLKTFYAGYFNNLFRVFFNTSLRQSQLTDQLLQAKLPSFLLNIFFIVSGGFYLWLLLLFYKPPHYIENHWLFPVCVGLITVIYLIKFLILKILGWVADVVPVVNNYIFIIFLINKIMGIILVPFIIMMAFMPAMWMHTAALVSFLVLGLLFLARYAKSYSLIDRQLKMNHFHFAIYAIAAEIIPMLLIFKAAKDYIL